MRCRIKPGKTKSLAQQMDEMFSRELALGGRASVNYAALDQVEHRAMPVDGIDAVLFFNPARVRSVMAKVDEESLRNRPCFLCPEGIGPEQLTLDWQAPDGNSYWIRVNPFPIFHRHFTISIARHERQQMAGHYADMLALAGRPRNTSSSTTARAAAPPPPTTCISRPSRPAAFPWNKLSAVAMPSALWENATAWSSAA